MVEFHKELLIGVKHKDGLNTDIFPLGFATPVGTDAAWKKRRDSVLKWAGRYRTKIDPVTKVETSEEYTGTIIENTLIDGFRFEKSVSRWSTSNKWFEINDPRGFTLQISAENLGEILLNSAIEKGELKGKFIWGRANGNWLCADTHPDYIKSLKPKDTTKPVPGDVLSLGYAGGDQQYIGKFFIFEKSLVSEFFSSTDNTWSETHPSYNYQNYNRKVPSRTVVKVTRSDKPWLIFARFNGNDPDMLYIHYQRTFGKFEFIEKGKPLIFNIADGDYVKENRGYNITATYAFTSKESMNAFDETLITSAKCRHCRDGKRPYYNDQCTTCGGTGKIDLVGDNNV